MSEREVYKTYDKVLAATIEAGDFGEFVIDEVGLIEVIHFGDGLKTRIIEYYDGKLTVEPRRFIEVYNELLSDYAGVL